MFGGNYLVVRVDGDDGTGAALVELIVVGVLGFVLYATITHVVQHTWQYAWIHVIAAQLYYWTAIVPFFGIAIVWNIVSSLTPWDNLNLVLAILAVPVYALAALVVICASWMGLMALIRVPPLGGYLLPGLLSLCWAVIEWLFA